MPTPNVRVAVTFNGDIGGSSVPVLFQALEAADCDVVCADYMDMLSEISKSDFDYLYSDAKNREKLFSHAKAKAILVLDTVDCLVLSGNSMMIDPILFGQPQADDMPYNWQRTISELALTHVAIQKGMPIYGVCGGHQVIAVYNGAHVRDLKPEEIPYHTLMSYDRIILNRESRLAFIMNPNKDNYVFGAHQQVVCNPGPNFDIAAVGIDGLVIEALESRYGCPILSTQFHPEIACLGLFNQTLHKGDDSQEQQSKQIFKWIHDAAQTYLRKKMVNTALVSAEETRLEDVLPVKPIEDYSWCIIGISAATGALVCLMLLPAVLSVSPYLCFVFGGVVGAMIGYVFSQIINELRACRLPKVTTNQAHPEKIMLNTPACFHQSHSLLFKAESRNKKFQSLSTHSYRPVSATCEH